MASSTGADASHEDIQNFYSQWSAVYDTKTKEQAAFAKLEDKDKEIVKLAFEYLKKGSGSKEGVPPTSFTKDELDHVSDQLKKRFSLKPLQDAADVDTAKVAKSYKNIMGIAKHLPTATEKGNVGKVEAKFAQQRTEKKAALTAEDIAELKETGVKGSGLKSEVVRSVFTSAGPGWGGIRADNLAFSEIAKLQEEIFQQREEIAASMNTYISTGEGDRTELLNKIAAYRQNCRVLLSVMELREQLDAKKLLLLPHLAANHGVGLHHQAKVMMEHEAYALSMEEILTTEGMNAKVQEKMEADGIAPHTAYQLLLTEGAITPSEARKTLETGVAEKLYRAFLWLNYARSRGDARAAISLAGLVLSTSDTCKQEYTGVEAAFKTAENYLDEAIKKGNDECRMDARDAMKSLKKLRFNTAFKNERPMEELSFAAQEVIADTKQITKSLPFREATFRKQALRKEVLELVEQKDKKKAVGILDKLEGFAKKRELTATESGKATTLKTQLEGLVKGDATQLVEGIENCVKRANEPADNYTVAELAFRNQILDLALKGSQEAVDEILDQIQKRSEKGLVGIGDIDALAEMAAHGFVAPKIMLQSETMKPYLDRVEKDIKKNIVTAESIQELGILAAHENSRASALLNGLKNSPNKGDDVKKAMQLVEELDVYNRYVDSPKKLKADQIIPVFDSQKRVDKMYLQASFTQKDVQFLEVAAKQNVKGAETLLTLIEERSKPRLPAANTAAEAKPSASEGQPVSQEERDKTRSGNTDTDRELIQAIDQHFTEGKVAASDLLRLKAAGEYDEASNLLKLIINTQGDEAFKNLSDEDLKIARETLIEITSNREQESFQKVEAGDQAAVPALNQLINRRCREGRAEMKDLEYLEAAAKKGSEWAEQLLTEIISNNGSKAFDHLDTASKTSVEQKLVEIDKEREQSAVDGIYLRLEGGV